MFHEYMKEMVKDRKIPAAVLIIQKGKEIVFTHSYGKYKDGQNNVKKTSVDTIFDLASLTKVVATLPSILLLNEKKALHLDDSIHYYLPEFKFKRVTIRNLLLHNSGLPADLPYKNRDEQRDVLKEIIHTEPIYKPGEKVKYTDLGMILLGKIIEKVAGERIDHFSTNQLYKPWGMLDTSFLPSSKNLDRIASTELFQGKYIHGVVHDEKAKQLGGVSGSAGLFSTAKDIAKYANYWLYPESQSVLLRESMELVHENIAENRGLGFEVWSGHGHELEIGR